MFAYLGHGNHNSQICRISFVIHFTFRCTCSLHDPLKMALMTPFLKGHGDSRYLSFWSRTPLNWATDLTRICGGRSSAAWSDRIVLLFLHWVSRHAVRALDMGVSVFGWFYSLLVAGKRNKRTTHHFEPYKTDAQMGVFILCLLGAEKDRSKQISISHILVP